MNDQPKDSMAEKLALILGRIMAWDGLSDANVITAAALLREYYGDDWQEQFDPAERG